MSVPDRIGIVQRDDSLEITAALDGRRAEALAVELRAIARRYGLRVRSVRVEAAGKPADKTARSGRRSV